MIEISEAAAIALHAMIYIANRENETISLKEIAEKFKISENHLSKVLQRLVKSGFLISIKGPKGGFQLVENKTNTSFMEIYDSIEGKKIKKTCLFSSKPQNCTNCIMGNLIHNINKEFTEYMNTHSITDFTI